MRTWTLGDRVVNRIGYGAMRLGADQDRAIAVLRRAVELGVNHIDTAAFYPVSGGGWVGTANELIRRALSPYPADLVIAVKVAPTSSGLARPDQLRGLVEENLRQLGRDQLDLVYLRQHGLDSIAEHLAVLARMRDDGLIRHLGLSNIRDVHLDQAADVAPVVAVQNRYGLDADRVNDGLLRTCGERGIAFVPFFAIVGDARESGGVATTDTVLEVARAHGVSPAQVRLAWTLHQGPHVLAIPGTGNPDHLAENLAAADLRLTDEDLARLG
jgi:aryl-alcohol dehydrogenase-like predicted oxidoreductase